MLVTITTSPPTVNATMSLLPSKLRLSFVSDSSPRPPSTPHPGEMKWESAFSRLIWCSHGATGKERRGRSSVRFVWLANHELAFKKKDKKVNERPTCAWDEWSRRGLTHKVNRHSGQ